MQTLFKNYRFLATIVLLIFVDMFWLLTGGIFARRMLEQIQNAPLAPRYISALVVYCALAYLVLKTKSVGEAFMLGVAVYAVYDFTNLAVFQDYDWRFAIADSIWGGVLFTCVHLILKSFS